MAFILFKDYCIGISLDCHPYLNFRYKTEDASKRLIEFIKIIGPLIIAIPYINQSKTPKI